MKAWASTAVLAGILMALSPVVMAQSKAEKVKFVERQSFPLRAGTLVLREQQGGSADGQKELALKSDGKVRKILSLAEFECGSVLGPYTLGENEVIGLNEPSCGCGNGCGDASSISLLSFDKAGNTVPANPAQRPAFDCDGLDEAAPQVSATSIKFKCIQREGRKTRSTFYSFENGRVKASRQ